MIEGVVVKPLVVHADVPDLPSNRTNGPGTKDVSRGFLMEVLRADEGLLKKFGQTTFTVAFPGTIKGFHWHARQDDLWFVASGRAGIVLHDLRSGSPTRGETVAVTVGGGDYKLLVIPAGVAHGYKVLGSEPVLLFYHTTEPYDHGAPDEQRIPWDDRSIGFDWDSLA